MKRYAASSRRHLSQVISHPQKASLLLLNFSRVLGVPTVLSPPLVSMKAEFFAEIAVVFGTMSIWASSSRVERDYPRYIRRRSPCFVEKIVCQQLTSISLPKIVKHPSGATGFLFALA